MASTILSDNGVSSGSAGIKTTADGTGALALQTTTAGGAATTAVTIDTSQNVTLAGALTATGVTTVQAGTAALPAITTTGDTNTGIFFPAADTVGVSTGGSERVRVDSSGYVLINKTSATTYGTIYAQAYISNTSGQKWLQVCDSTVVAGSCQGLYVGYSVGTPNNAGNEFLYCTDATAQRFTVRSNGGLANYSANNVNLSDRRQKTNFAPAKSYLDVICAIPVQTFNYIDQNLEEDPGLTLGVVAQDVQAVAPELVHESNWGTKEDPKMRLSIYQTDLQYALMKSIQEQQALITALTARITALEAK